MLPSHHEKIYLWLLWGLRLQAQSILLFSSQHYINPDIHDAPLESYSPIYLWDENEACPDVDSDGALEDQDRLQLQPPLPFSLKDGIC